MNSDCRIDQYDLRQEGYGRSNSTQSRRDILNSIDGGYRVLLDYRVSTSSYPSTRQRYVLRAYYANGNLFGKCDRYHPNPLRLSTSDIAPGILNIRPNSVSEKELFAIAHQGRISCPEAGRMAPRVPRHSSRPARQKFSTSYESRGSRGGRGRIFPSKLFLPACTRNLPAKLGITLLNLGLLLTPVVMSRPAQGAEEIYISYGPLEFSLPVSALEVYAKEGKINQDLAFYARYLDRKQLEQLRKILLTRVDVTPLAISQFLYSPQGEIILRRVGQIIQTKATQPGFYAIRSALILAAADPEGLTLLNVLRKFPTYGIRINSGRGFQVIEGLSDVIRQTGTAIAAVEKESLAEAAAEESAQSSGKTSTYPLTQPNRFSRLPDLRQAGAIQYSMQTLMLNDMSRGRSFPVDLYLPTLPSGVAAPLIVISHGLGSDRQTFKYLANHLASYGFAVAVPEHPGSNAKQLQALVNGLANEVTAPTELVDRPLDIKFLLDELDRSFQGRINMQEVGVLGQSFGAYTALALAGAKINFERLRKDCDPSNESLNLSLLLQCRALVLPPTDYKLSDERIKAAIAINPVGSTIFGKSQLSQIQIPLMLIAGSDDTVAPALPEQIQPFTWLNTPNKYLVLLKGGTHFSTLGQSSDAVQLPDKVLGPAPDVAQNYMKALSVAFFETYIVNKPDYRVYLSASYARHISQYTLPLSLVQSLTESQLKQANEDSTPAPTPSPKP